MMLRAGIHSTAGEVAIVGPAISVMDADLGAAPAAAAKGGHRNAAEARRAAQHFALCQEVCSMLGAAYIGRCQLARMQFALGREVCSMLGAA